MATKMYSTYLRSIMLCGQTVEKREVGERGGAIILRLSVIDEEELFSLAWCEPGPN